MHSPHRRGTKCLISKHNRTADQWVSCLNQGAGKETTMATVSVFVDIDLQELVDDNEEEILEIVRERKVFENDGMQKRMDDRLNSIIVLINALRTDIERI
jgi:hypothetical protein